MPKQAAELGPLAVSRLTEPGLHFVGGVPGLALQVAPTGARTWVLRMTVGGRRRDMGLGGFPAVTLAQARDAAREARAKVKAGTDPIEEARAARSKLQAERAAALTFDQCATKFVKAHAPGWSNPKHAQQWTNTLQSYASPVLGELLVRDVELSHVLAVLEPIWHTKTETASRVRGRIEQVLDWATARGYRQGLNPARWRGHLDKLLPAPAKVSKVENCPAVQVGQAGAFMCELKQREGMGARALEFLLLTAVRSQNVRAARWSEIDLDAAVWEIPGDAVEGASKQRMKSGKAHRVPLPPAAVELLRALPRMADNPLVFPAARGAMLSDMTLSAVMRRMGFKDKDGRVAVPHGLRSTFRDWAAERTHYPREVAEMVLAHAVGDKVEAAYRRGDLFEKRRRLMDDWAAFLSRVELPGVVVPLHSASAT
ncbi:site-specific integrase [uncultured Azohydromonas sp.]|jgi:Integrase|uniref:tyrosine-type recombinase/integrase n=1 Tax=uncultured Azohydromonas sp. TaxID=487342 RepID=UPI002635A37D|nr:site-specific integrase [uncultured Azohydromonas sp.]